jgi:uncharacterized protein
MDIIKETANYVRSLQEGESSGHDWWHTYRVWQMAKRIARKEKADLRIVELAALLHDIADWKFHAGDEEAGPRAARKWLRGKVFEADIRHVCHIIANLSYKGAKTEQVPLSIEGQTVQDADRLDAIGAIGIARVFAYNGRIGREIHHPDARPIMHRSFSDYKRGKGTAINHFHEKLLLLKDRMNTREGKRLARRRHDYMVRYLKEFHEEWDCKT